MPDNFLSAMGVCGHKPVPQAAGNAYESEW